MLTHPAVTANCNEVAVTIVGSLPGNLDGMTCLGSEFMVKRQTRVTHPLADPWPFPAD